MNQALLQPASVEELVGRTVFPMRRTPNLLTLHATARDASTSHEDFVRTSRRLIRLLVEESLGHLRHHNLTVTTPTGFEFTGRRREQPELYAVTVPRAGDAIEAELRDLCPGTRFGKVLIQRDPVSKEPQLFYSKLPAGIAEREVLLLDPMMATGGTILLTIGLLIQAGVREEDIIVVNVLTCPSALATLADQRPAVRTVTSFIDESLTPDAFMRPGIGDFGDRFFGSLA